MFVSLRAVTIIVKIVNITLSNKIDTLDYIRRILRLKSVVLRKTASKVHLKNGNETLLKLCETKIMQVIMQNILNGTICHCKTVPAIVI